MKQILRHIPYVLLLGAIFISPVVKADTWDDPRVLTYYSQNKEYKLVVTPRILPEKYLQWHYYKSNKHPQTARFLRRKEKFMRNILPQDTMLIPCTGKLYRFHDADSVLLWEKVFLNDISPVYAIVADDGSIVASFDNWHSKGYGVNVFVVYNEKGEAKRTYKLEEFSPFPLNDYSRSVSSISWYKKVWFLDNERIELAFQTEDGRRSNRIYNVRTFEFEN
ncbi:hypothetical protein [Limibacterium fermenti]|uniref:hypothetical protein n=1 Tax=Limibacterium fermenti TaxID=3229863 RepID=UPI003A703957